jgi:mRNA-degrading endonuclease RelE of RelBE toxin-antitoxin system
MYEAVMKKVQEILTCDGVNHYKNLKKPLQDFKRVHIKSSFVLIFQYLESEDKVIFFDLDHHDNIYCRR